MSTKKPSKDPAPLNKKASSGNDPNNKKPTEKPKEPTKKADPKTTG